MTQLEPTPAAPPGALASRTEWRTWAVPVGVALFVVVIGGAYAATFILPLVTSVVFIFGGLLYGIVGMVLIGARWVYLPKTNGPLVVTLPLAEAILGFRTRAQRVTFTLNIVLLVNLLIAVIVVVTAVGGYLPALVCGAIAQVGGLALIIANAFWAYRTPFILGEHAAIARKAGKYRLIRTNRILSYLVWGLHSGVAGIAVVVMIAPGPVFT